MIAEPTSALDRLEARVANQPWQTVGGAFLLGAWAGWKPLRAPRSRVTRAVFSMIGSFALRVLREAAFRDLLHRAPRPPAHEHGASAHEHGASAHEHGASAHEHGARRR
jgi:hypothetical protein